MVVEEGGAAGGGAQYGQYVQEGYVPLGGEFFEALLRVVIDTSFDLGAHGKSDDKKLKIASDGQVPHLVQIGKYKVSGVRAPRPAPVTERVEHRVRHFPAVSATGVLGAPRRHIGPV